LIADDQPAAGWQSVDQERAGQALRAKGAEAPHCARPRLEQAQEVRKRAPLPLGHAPHCGRNL
jgi:hypothetical protein